LAFFAMAGWPGHPRFEGEKYVVCVATTPSRCLIMKDK